MSGSKNAEYQAEYRRKQREQGYTEVRGLYAPADKHAQIKAQIRKQMKGEGK